MSKGRGLSKDRGLSFLGFSPRTSRDALEAMVPDVRPPKST